MVLFKFFHISVFIQSVLRFTNEVMAASDFPKEYTFLADTQSYYKIHTSFKTWKDAKKNCELEGASFFYPQNKCEAGVVFKFLNETQPYSWVYIGVSSPIATGVFETVDSRLINEVYNYWGPWEPNNADGLEGCVILRRDETLNDDGCEKKYPFICKRSTDAPKENAVCRKESETTGQPSANFFRKDYTFVAETQSFYKIHTIHGNWQYAKKKCALEGASLFYPEDEAEAEVVLHFWNQTQPFSWVFIGVSSLFTKGVFETIDGRQITDVYSKWGPGEPNDAGGVEDCVILRREGTLNDDMCEKKYPFICKKTLASVEWNILCDIPDMSYVYNEALGKCYKFHLTPTNWTEAYAVCGAEQSYLAVINSQDEADHLVKITEQAPKEKVAGNFLAGAVYLGYRNLNEEGWKSVKGQTLEESGYNKWGNKQPDGGDRETCGSMFYNGLLNDLSCDTKCFFICEHDIGALSGSLNERFGQ